LTGPAIAATDLGLIDAVLVGHDHHGDNLDSAGRLGGNARGLQPWATTTRSPTTLAATEIRLRRHVRPFFGDRPIEAIQPMLIRQWQNQRRRHP
jgi:Phage integrase, N-terminal SAM-like domain